MKIKVFFLYLLVCLGLTFINFPETWSLFLKRKHVFWLFGFSLFAPFLILKDKRKQLNFQFTDLILVFIFFIVIVSMLWFKTSSIYSATVWLFLAYLCVFWVAHATLNSNSIKIPLLGSILTCGVLNAAMGYLQMCNLVASENKYFDINGFFYSPNQFGAALGLGLLSAVLLLWNSHFKWIVKTLIVIAILFIVPMFIKSNSRGALLALLLAMLFVMVQHSRIKQLKPLIKIGFAILLLSIFCVLAVFLYHKNPDSIDGRSFILKLGSQQIFNQPWGYGLDGFSQNYNTFKAHYFETARTWKEIKNAGYAYHATNDFLNLTFELGILWLVAILILGYYTFKNKTLNPSVLSSKTILVFLTVFGFTNTIIQYPFFIVILMLCFVLIQKQQTQKTIFALKNSVLIKYLKLAPLFLLLVLMSKRIWAENKLMDLNKETIGQVSEQTLFNYTNKIKEQGRAYDVIAKYYYKAEQMETATAYLDTAFAKNAWPKIGRRYAFMHLRASNLSKAEAIFKYNAQTEPYRFKPKIDLLKLYLKHNDYKNAIKTAKEIQDLPVKIPSEKVEKHKAFAEKIIQKYQNFKIDSTLNGLLSKPFRFKSKILNKRLPYQVYLPPLNYIHQKLPVLYVNDGSWYKHKGGFVKKVDALIKSKKIQPIAVVLISTEYDLVPKDIRSDVRNALYLCNPKYNDFFMRELLPKTERSYPIDPNNRSLLGVSFGGLAAAYTAIEYKHDFKNVLLQSPAFHPRKFIYKAYQKKLTNEFNVYMSYGTAKDTQKQDKPFAKILESKNIDFKLNIIEDGNHNWKNWSSQFDEILTYYFGTNKKP